MAHPADGDLTNYAMTSPLRIAKPENDLFDADPFRRSLPAHGYDPAAVLGEIQFQRRAHEASRGMRSLYGGPTAPPPDAPPSPTTLAHQDAARFAGRKQSLVRPEDYMAPVPNYNPYVARVRGPSLAIRTDAGSPGPRSQTTSISTSSSIARQWVARASIRSPCPVRSRSRPSRTLAARACPASSAASASTAVLRCVEAACDRG